MATGTAATKYWHCTEDGRVQCNVCPRIAKPRDTDTLADQATPAAIARVAAELDYHSVAFSNNDLPRVRDGRGE
jgi:hypothetical protein